MKKTEKHRARLRAIHARMTELTKGAAEDDDRDFTTDEQSEFDALETEARKVQTQIDREDRLAELEKAAAAVVVHEPKSDSDDDSKPTVKAEPKGPVYRTFGEQLADIYRAGKHPLNAPPARLAEHLKRYEAAATGMGEAIDHDGGYAVQVDFAGMMFDSAAKEGEILSRVDTYEIGAGSNAAKWVDVDESTVASTVFGGVQVYWADEGATVTASKPKLKKRQMELEKLFGLAYATEELVQDTSFISDLYTRAFSLAIRRKVEGDIVNGDGAGKPLGILQGNGLITVTKESGQATGSVDYKNIVKMWHRHINPQGPSVVWLVHPDTYEQLEFMDFPVGTGGVPVFLPPGGMTAQPFATLRGKPLISCDHCSTNGSAGDLILADLSDYMLIRKGDVQSAVSMHVRFINDEQTFRFTFRCNGQPKHENTVTIKNSSTARGYQVALGARA